MKQWEDYFVTCYHANLYIFKILKSFEQVLNDSTDSFQGGATCMTHVTDNCASKYVKNKGAFGLPTKEEVRIGCLATVHY